MRLGISEPGDRTALRCMVNEVIEKDAAASIRDLEEEEGCKREAALAKRRLVGSSPPAIPVVAGAQLIAVTADGAFQLVRPVAAAVLSAFVWQCDPMPLAIR